MRSRFELALCACLLASCTLADDGSGAESFDERGQALFIPDLDFDFLWIEYKLRVHTCDKNYATTVDTSTARFNFNGALGQLSSTVTLTNAGRTRNHWDETIVYLNPFGGFGALESMVIGKRGNDGWCIDQAEIVSGGTKLWSFKASDYRADPYVVDRPQGALWIDDDRSADAPTSSLKFSDLKVKTGVQAQLPVELAITTCSAVTNAYAATNDPVTLDFGHDGVVDQIVLDNPGTDRVVGATDKYVIDEHGFWHADFLRLSKKGADGWCIKKMELTVAGRTWKNFFYSGLWLEGDEGEVVQWKETLNRDFEATSVGEAYVGLPLRREPPPAKISATVTSASGCAYSLQAMVSVSNSGGKSGTATIGVEASASGYAYFTFPDGDWGTPIRLAPFNSSGYEDATVTVVAGETKMVTINLDFSTPDWADSVDLSLAATVNDGPREVRPYTDSWDSPEGAPTSLGTPPRAVCF
jgi:hypothetical protein